MLKIHELSAEIKRLEGEFKLECEKLVGKDVMCNIDNELQRVTVNDSLCYGVLGLEDGRCIAADDVVGVVE